MTPAQDATALLPCPFCGGEPIIRSSDWIGLDTVWCPNDDCSAAVETTGTPEEAIAKWNTRSTPSASAGPQAEAVDEDWNIRKYIDFLRADEGDSVTLLCDNPDFNGQPNCAIECNGYWTNWQDRRFAADTLQGALELAYFECRQWRENPPPEVSPDPRFAHPQPQQAASPADEIIGQIEERFPDWRGFRDLVDCIDVTLHRLRGGS